MCEHDFTPRPPARMQRRRVLLSGVAFAAVIPTWRRDRGVTRRQPDRFAVVQPIEVIPGLKIFPRDAWGADLPAKSELRSEQVKFLLVHHSGTPNITTDARQFIRSVYSFHTGPEKGWADVCYQFFIDPTGVIWEGRAGSLDGPVVADATGGSQGFAQLVCLIGDFNQSMPSVRMLDSLRLLLAWLADRYGLDTSPGATASFDSRGSQRWKVGAHITTPTLNGHRAMSYTDCPGDRLWTHTTTSLQAEVHALRTQLPAFEQPSDDSGLVPARRGVRRTLRS